MLTNLNITPIQEPMKLRGVEQYADPFTKQIVRETIDTLDTGDVQFKFETKIAYQFTIGSYTSLDERRNSVPFFSKDFEETFVKEKDKFIIMLLKC